jgi:hypothetical protein
LASGAALARFAALASIAALASGADLAGAAALASVADLAGAAALASGAALASFAALESVAALKQGVYQTGDTSRLIGSAQNREKPIFSKETRASLFGQGVGLAL